MNPPISLTGSALLTDLYQLTMLEGYHDSGMEDIAVFEFFVRKLRPGRGFLMAAGLEQSLQFLEGLHFSSEELAWLASTGRFNKEFLASLETLRFHRRCARDAGRHDIFSRTNPSCASPLRSRRRNWSRRG